MRLCLPHTSHLQLLGSVGEQEGQHSRTLTDTTRTEFRRAHTQHGSALPAHGAAQPPPAKTTAIPSAGTAAQGSSLLEAENPPASHPTPSGGIACLSGSPTCWLCQAQQNTSVVLWPSQGKQTNPTPHRCTHRDGAGLSGSPYFQTARP